MDEGPIYWHSHVYRQSEMGGKAQVIKFDVAAYLADLYIQLGNKGWKCWNCGQHMRITWANNHRVSSVELMLSCQLVGMEQYLACFWPNTDCCVTRLKVTLNSSLLLYSFYKTVTLSSYTPCWCHGYGFKWEQWMIIRRLQLGYARNEKAMLQLCSTWKCMM